MQFHTDHNEENFQPLEWTDDGIIIYRDKITGSNRVREGFLDWATIYAFADHLRKGKPHNTFPQREFTRAQTAYIMRVFVHGDKTDNRCPDNRSAA